MTPTPARRRTAFAESDHRAEAHPFSEKWCRRLRPGPVLVMSITQRQPTDVDHPRHGTSTPRLGASTHVLPCKREAFGHAAERHAARQPGSAFSLRAVGAGGLAGPAAPVVRRHRRHERFSVSIDTQPRGCDPPGVPVGTLVAVSARTPRRRRDASARTSRPGRPRGWAGTRSGRLLDGGSPSPSGATARHTGQRPPRPAGRRRRHRSSSRRGPRSRVSCGRRDCRPRPTATVP